MPLKKLDAESEFYKKSRKDKSATRSWNRVVTMGTNSCGDDSPCSL